MSVSPTESQQIPVQSVPTPEPVLPMPTPVPTYVDPVGEQVGPVDANGPIVAPEPTPVAVAPETAVQQEPKEDLEVIVPVTADNLTVNGIPVSVTRLKSRALFALIRVMTNGLGASFDQFDLNVKDRDAMGAQVAAMAVMAIPNAYDEFVYFVNLVTKPRLASQAQALQAELVDPEIDDLIDLMSVVAQQEAGDFMQTVKKVQAAAKMIPGMGSPTTGR